LKERERERESERARGEGRASEQERERGGQRERYLIVKKLEEKHDPCALSFLTIRCLREREGGRGGG